MKRKTHEGKDAISPSAPLRNLNTTFIGKRILHYPVVASTMDVAREMAALGAAEGTCVTAGEQTAARGRLGRSWLSPQGSVAVSIILKPPIEQLPQLIMIASLAVVNAIERTCGIKADIKWPNDVLIHGKKVCGILIENAIRGAGVEWAVIGIGLNTNLDPARFPEIATIATSLSSETGGEVPPPEVLGALLSEIELLYLAAQRGEPIHEQWISRLETLGKMVQVRSGDVIDSGVAESVGKDGSLLLRRADGSPAVITAGDVTILKDTL